MLIMTNYYAFTDESNYNSGEHRSLSIIMINEFKVKVIDDKLKEILNKYKINIKSFKWNKINNRKKQKALIEFLMFLFPFLEKRLVFITTLKWSINDSRHCIIGRDDLSNLSFMYYKLIFDIVNRKTENGDNVKIFPDYNDVINWEELEKILSNSEIHNTEKIKIRDSFIEVGSKKVFLEPSTTEDKYLIQIADIFAGIARGSFEDYKHYVHWLNSPEDSTDSHDFSGREKCRFEIYDIINKWAKRNKLYISLDSKQGFFSYKPDSPLNFWVYSPQHENDKAPTK